MACETITCDAPPLITRFLSAVRKTDDGCYALRVNKLTGDCRPAVCNEINSVNNVLDQVVLNDKIQVREVVATSDELITCAGYSLNTLFASALTETIDGCKILNISEPIADPGCVSDCDDKLTIQEKIARSFALSDDDCVLLLVVDSDAEEVVECDEVNTPETTLHKLLVKLPAPNEGFYAWRTTAVI